MRNYPRVSSQYKSRRFWLPSLPLICLATALCIVAGYATGSVLATKNSQDAPDAPAAVIFDNGGLATGATSNSGVAAPAGTQWSEGQSNFGNTTESNTLNGVGCQLIGAATANRCADDFNVPVGQTWTTEIAGIALVLRLVESVFQSVLFGYERYDLAARISMVMNALPVVALLSAQTVRLSSRCNTTMVARTYTHHTPRRATLRLRMPICARERQPTLRVRHVRRCAVAQRT